MKTIRALRRLTCASAVMALAACAANSFHSVGGTLSGLNTGATLTLQDNGADNLALTANGPFSFPTFVEGGASYNVTILTQPAGQLCMVSGGSGTVDSTGDPVNSVVVTCTSTASISGTVAGLAPGTSVTLGNGADVLPVAENGAFAFPGTVNAGTTYAVTVLVQPDGETCTVTNGTGTIQANVATQIAVTCS